MQNVEEGTFMYVEFMTMTSVETFISIKRSVDEPDITCSVSQGDVILLRHPNKLYLSFKAESSSAKFFIHASYSATQKNTKFVNKEKCSDAGASLGDALNFNTNDSGGSSDNNGGGSVSLNPKIDIVTKTGRESYIRN